MTPTFNLPVIRLGRLRIQVLSPFLMRLEVADISGFEDQKTFHIQNRYIEKSDFDVRMENGYLVIFSENFELKISVASNDFSQTYARSRGGHRWEKVRPVNNDEVDLPEPGLLPDIWVFKDYPRLIPPEWGATAPPEEYQDDFLSGWGVSDTENDLYLFFPKASGYKRFREDFLKLTGHIPLIPKCALGFIYSRYHPYSEDEIIDLIYKFRLRRMPIDIFVVDTDWRENASHGYDINTKLFPMMERFFMRTQNENVKVMFNDHPEPIDEPLSPKELNYREENLAKMFEKGLDFWWFDRNWKKCISDPAPGLKKDIWGMKLYHDIALKRNAEKRPMIMANVPGIDSGERIGASGVSAHRYPIWWTGDTQPEWKSLENGIRNGVNEGILSLLPYVNEDIGGHFGMPTSELYNRFVQFGCLSSVFRLHCTAGTTRYPWEFGDESERTAANFIKFRLRLLPMLYAAAKKASLTGEPIMRRCDLEWQNEVEAMRSDQYMLGDDILVAPIYKAGNSRFEDSEPETKREFWVPPGIWHDLWSGETIRGPLMVNILCRQWKLPILARNGGLIVSQPEEKNSSEQTWKNLILDVFVPVDPQKIIRTIYEDDGETNDYLDGKFRETTIEIERISDKVNINISASAGYYNDGLRKRNWNIRFHFTSFSELITLELNRKILMEPAYKLLAYEKRPITMPIITRMGAKGPKSGKMIELELKEMDLKSDIHIGLTVIEQYMNEEDVVKQLKDFEIDTSTID